MLQGVTAFFAYMWWWLSCRMAELLDFFFLCCMFHPSLWLLSFTAPFFKENALSASSQSSVMFSPSSAGPVPAPLQASNNTKYFTSRRLTLIYIPDEQFKKHMNSETQFGFQWNTVLQSKKNWNFLKFRDCLLWGLSQRFFLSKSS